MRKLHCSSKQVTNRIHRLSVPLELWGTNPHPTTVTADTYDNYRYPSIFGLAVFGRVEKVLWASESRIVWCAIVVVSCPVWRGRRYFAETPSCLLGCDRSAANRLYLPPSAGQGRSETIVHETRWG